jgi:hypothetical protein
MCTSGFLAVKQIKSNRISTMFMPTVAKIVANFQKTIDQLESLKASQEVRIGKFTETIEDAEEQRAIADLEATRAGAVADRIRKLIEPAQDTVEFDDEELWGDGLQEEKTDEV